MTPSAAALVLAAAATVGTSPSFARDQLVFAAVAPEPVVTVLVVQRSEGEEGVTLEAKAFVAWRGRWQTPFYERLSLPAWPGERLDSALAAWRDAPAAAPKRLRWTSGDEGLALAIRRPEGALVLVAGSMAPAGGTEDPHGRVTWRAGAATLTLNGRTFEGHAAHERLEPPAVAWPSFGRFEMWVLAPEAGGLVLGRAWLGSRRGEALVVDAGGRAAVAAFSVEPLETSHDPETGFALPVRWRVAQGAEGVLTRGDGARARGSGAQGGPAVYDIGVALEDGGGALAVVLHLQDGAHPAAAQRSPSRRY